MEARGRLDDQQYDWMEMVLVITGKMIRSKVETWHHGAVCVK
jgi:hypothetical protein